MSFFDFICFVNIWLLTLSKKLSQNSSSVTINWSSLSLTVIIFWVEWDWVIELIGVRFWLWSPVILEFIWKGVISVDVCGRDAIEDDCNWIGLAEDNFSWLT